MPGQGFSRKASTAILCTFLACMTNVVFLEHIIKIDSSAGTLVTFCQFTFVSIAGCLTWWQFGKRTNQVPMKRHLVLVALFWSVNFANNLAFKFSIPMTLHTIFRSGSLASNMFMGVMLMKKSYRTDKYRGWFWKVVYWGGRKFGFLVEKYILRYSGPFNVR